MKKLPVLAMLAFAVVGGAAAVLIIDLKPATACVSPNAAPEGSTTVNMTKIISSSPWPSRLMLTL